MHRFGVSPGVTEPDGRLKLPEPEPGPSGLRELGDGVVKVLACFWNRPELSRVKLPDLLLLNWPCLLGKALAELADTVGVVEIVGPDFASQ